MPAHRKLAAAAVVLAIGLGLALLFPAQRPPREVAEPHDSIDSSPTSKTRSGHANQVVAQPTVASEVVHQSALGTSSASSPQQVSSPPSDPPRATLTTVTAVQPDPRPDLADPPELPEQYPREDPSTLRPVYPSVFDGGTGDDFEPGPYDERIHTVRDGDTLESLAKRYLGSPARAVEIYELNTQLIVQQEVLPIGVDLRIPPQQVPSTPDHGAISSQFGYPLLPQPSRPQPHRRRDLEAPPIDARPDDAEGLVPIRPLAPDTL